MEDTKKNENFKNALHEVEKGREMVEGLIEFVNQLNDSPIETSEPTIVDKVEQKMRQEL